MDFQGDRGGRWSYDPAQPLGPPGGFGRVYAGEAEDGATVAVKVVNLGTGMGARLRYREKEIAEKLEGVAGEHLMQTLDVAEVGSDLLLVMERADQSLADHLLAAGRLSDDDAVAILREVAAGMRELHQSSVIHRDLKPGNVLLHEGRWKLCDFGIARDADLGTQTVTFLGAGTPPYMAPELWAGQSPTFKSDLYAAGCIAFELVSGSPPFRGPDEEDFRRQHTVEPPPDPAAHDHLLRRLILRALSKDPASRQQDARAWEETLAKMGTSLSQAGPLAALAAEHAKERSQADAAAAAVTERERLRTNLGRQAAEDLEDAFLEALTLIRREIPEVEFSWDGNNPMLVGDDGSLRIHVEPVSWSLSAEDLGVGFGEVTVGNRRDLSDILIADIFYQRDEGGRYCWFVYRFRMRTGVTSYPFGPSGRPHGLSKDDFFKQRRYVNGNTTHVFTVERTPVTGQTISDLYAEGLALRKF